LGNTTKEIMKAAFFWNVGDKLNYNKSQSRIFYAENS
jgi:hypothetical protein